MIRLVILFILYLLIVPCANGKLSKCKVELQTEAGRVCGRIRRADDGSKYASFRGVPYAKPPLGERRFKELEPLDPWEGLLDATKDGPACPQKNLIYGSITLQPKGLSEDCIHLNLHVPYHALPQGTGNIKTQPLPILVNVHGGGFNAGSGLTDLHGPEYLIGKNVIVISFNYRLNVFGFLSLGTKEIPGNQGLRDMVTLLKWVQRHARAFGGYPDNVTLLGQSAGAVAVHLLSLSKATEGLFQRIILLSGSAITNLYTTSPYYSKNIADSFLRYLNINSTDLVDIHEQLTKMPLVSIMRANSMVQYDGGVISFMPVVEDVYPGVTPIITEDPMKTIADGEGDRYPAIIGYTSQEVETFRYFILLENLFPKTEQNPLYLLPMRFFYNIPMEELMKLGGQISQKFFNGNASIDKLIFSVTHTCFIYPALQLTEWRGLKGVPTYLYKYTYKSERNIIKESLWIEYDGTAHIEDLTFIFKVNSMINENDVSIPPKNNDDRMKDWMTSFITNFMKCSNPTCSKNESQWPPQSGQVVRYQNIQEPMVYKMSDLSDEERDIIAFLKDLDEEGK